MAGEGREDGGYDSLSRGGTQLYEKIMETLTLKGAFIGFPNNLKWLDITSTSMHIYYTFNTIFVIITCIYVEYGEL